MAAKKTTSNSVAGKLYNAEVEAGTTELSFNEFKAAYLAAQEAEKASTAEVLEVVEGAIVATESAIETVVVAKAVGKAELSRAIFAEELAKQTESGVAMVRKDVLARFIAEAGLTKAGANTYFQNFRSKAGLTHQVKAVAEEVAAA